MHVDLFMLKRELQKVFEESVICIVETDPSYAESVVNVFVMIAFSRICRLKNLIKDDDYVISQ